MEDVDPFEGGPFLDLEGIYTKLYSFFRDFDITPLGEWYMRNLSFITFVGVVVGLTCLFATSFLLYKLYQVRLAESRKVKGPLYPERGEPVPTETNKKWARVTEHIHSENPSDWRLAILEADLILEEMLDRMGYAGETIGDRLKRVERSDFTTIDSAWEAHKVRNEIVHRGTDFSLNDREARRVVDLYRRVFEEFHYL